jgi:pimeloyl-ACP methyl ester carboxylesterase
MTTPRTDQYTTTEPTIAEPAHRMLRPARSAMVHVTANITEWQTWGARQPHLAGGFHPRRSRAFSLWLLAGRLVVTLSGMSDIKHVVLIHGMSGCGDYLAPAGTAFEERGYTVHIPTLRHHELPLEEGATKIASLSLREYADDLVKLVDSLDSAALLVGHSMGGLLAQLVVADRRHLCHISDVAALRIEALPAATAVGQACVSPYVGTVSKVNRKCPNRGACPRAIRRTGLRLRASDVRGRLPMAGPRQSRHCQLLSDHNAGACDCGCVRSDFVAADGARDGSALSAGDLR